jgi:predicted nucleotide-binding protein
MLDQTIGVIEAGKFQERKARLEKAKGPMGPISGSKVFVVHGHDDSAREGVARFLEKLKLEPIILHEQPSAGRTIIEKVERYAEVAYAVVLLTPDDVGAVATASTALKPRARQNVILELGYFLGRLGRTHVAALVKGEVEKPSDYDGVVYVPMDSAGAWKLQLAKELKSAGLNVDLNDAV